MRVLIVKTSSLGDVIHTLPAVTDAQRAIPDITFEWVVEEAFAEIPSWHPAVSKVIPVALRRWRKSPLKSVRSPEWKGFKSELRRGHYDAVIDAQGLLKSAWIARQSKGPRYGMDRRTVREPLASLAYHHKVAVPKEQHAVERVRQLFAAALGYSVPETQGEYGIDSSRFQRSGESGRSVVFLHGTTRHAKHWPETYWIDLCQRVTERGYEVQLLWGNEHERERAERIAATSPQAMVMPKLNLSGVAELLSQAKGVVAVDTGLGHLCAALDLPTISLYGPTSPKKVGAYGHNQRHITAAGLPKPDDLTIDPIQMAPLTPSIVWQALLPILES